MASSPQLASSVPDAGKNPSPTTNAQAMHVPNMPSGSSLASPEDSAKVAPAPDIPVAPLSEDVFAVLRRSIGDESQPPDALIRATSEAARVLTVADGVAIAFRHKGVILCRARSGDLAPDVGSYVNANSGISGECLRTATILVCQDARTDTRVDNLVCERMGIRSIVVVPLRGSVGICGILEVFSTRVNAFGNREINCLRSLAEIAEAAYGRERSIQQEAIRTALRSAHRLPALFQRSDTNQGESWGTAQDLSEFQGETTESRPERLVWAVGVAIVALLMILGVWLSWHGPISELAELEAAENHSTVQAAPKPIEIAAPKPTPVVARGENQKPHRLYSAKKPSAEQLIGARNSALFELPGAKTPSHTTSSVLPTQPPVVKINASAAPSQFAGLLTGQEAFPVIAASVSHAVIPGDLIRKVDPAYPLSARAQRITGPVVLEIHVGQDGTVRNVRTISGDPQLVGAAVDAVRQWQYAPTLVDGHAIEVTKQITVRFKLP